VAVDESSSPGCNVPIYVPSTDTWTSDVLPLQLVSRETLNVATLTVGVGVGVGEDIDEGVGAVGEEELPPPPPQELVTASSTATTPITHPRTYSMNIDRG
jgi:hypothetical protein